MSEATQLLNDLNEPISSNEQHIIIDSDRFISVPGSLKRLGVQYDHDIETVTFDCPRYWDNHDLSVMNIYVNYLRSDRTYGMFKAVNVVVDKDDSRIIHFDWTISRNVTLTAGKIAFLVCAKNVAEDGTEQNHWNSELCKDCYISEGLELDGNVSDDIRPDIIEGWYREVLELMNSIKPEAYATKEYVDELFENVTTVETDPTVPDWAKQPNKPTYTAAEVGAATPEYVNTAINNIPPLSDEQVETAVAAYLDSHPEATTTIADGSITHEKLAFHAYEGTLSPNLIDPDGLISARFISVSGGRKVFSEGGSYYNAWRMTDYIDVSEHIGEQIWLANMQGYCFYDSTKTAIPNSGYYNSDMNVSGDLIGIEIPEGASYVVLSMFNATGRTFTANFGSELLAYVPYGEILFPNNVVGADNIKGQLPLDKIDTSNLLLPTVGVNLIDKSKMIKDYSMNTSGVLVAQTSSLSYWCVTDIPVVGGQTYLVYGRSIVFFDAYGNVCGSDTGSGYRKITTPVSAVYCAVNSTGYSNTPANMEHGAFLIRGDKLPDKVVNGKYYDGSALDNKTMYKSVLHRMEDCWNPSTKTIIGLYGDSNTYGIKGNGNVTQNPECWANLLTSEIQRKLVGERYIHPFGDIGVWGGDPYNSEVKLGNAVIKVPFYGTSISMESGTVAPVPITINVSFDDGEFEECTIEEAGRYTWDGLEEGYHTITIIGPKSSNFCISRFVVNKQVEVINRAVSGQALGSIVGAVGEVEDTIEIICSGTNNRGGTVLKEEVKLSLWEYQNRATKHIYISPIPSWDTIEEANEPWKTIPYIESFIAGREARKNCEYISLYHEIKDYCIKNNVELQSLYVEGLHLNDAGHKVVAQILCRKLGLGDLTETTE